MSIKNIRLSAFSQNTEAVEIDGEFFPPTFNWYANLIARRESDGQDFFVKIVVPRGKDMDINSVANEINNGLLSLEAYAEGRLDWED